MKSKNPGRANRAMFEGLEERIALAINYAIKPGTTLDIFPLSSIIPAAPAGMDRMEVLLPSVPGVAHGTIYRISGVSAFPWGSGPPNVFTVGAGNNRINGGEGFRYVNNGTGNGTSETIPVRFRDGTGFNTLNETIVITLNANLQPPTITTEPGPFIQITPGSKANMSVVASGAGPLTYQWFQGIAPNAANPIPGATSASYQTPVLNTIQQYMYWVRVSNAGGSVASQTVTVQTALPTSVFTSDYSTTFRSTAHTVNMTATVDPATNAGKVTFNVVGIGSQTQSATIVAGQTGNTPFPVPAGAPAGTYALQAHYQGPAGLADSFDNQAFTINQASTGIDTANLSASSGGSNQAVNMTATVTSAAPVHQGTITFTLLDGANQIGSPATTPTVANGAAATNFTLPANIRGGSYTIRAEYNPSVNYLGSTILTRRFSVFPLITANTAALNANATSLTINGFGFSPTLADNVITFPAGVTGSVTAATANSITISNLTGLVAGALNVQVNVRGQLSSAAQVAAVRPVITAATTALNGSATTLTINGFGFSNTPASNVMAFTPSQPGSVTTATRTQLVYTFSVPPSANGNLMASVTSNGVSSGAAVQVATLDTAKPTASAGQVIRNAPNFGKLSVTFNETIAPALLLSKLSVSAVGGAPQTLVPSAVVQDAVTKVAVYSFATPFSDRNYRATLTASGLLDAAGNQMAANYVFDFFLLAADTNLDRTVDHLDFNALHANFGGINKLWAQGDCNGDGKVNFLDFQILERNFGKSVPMPAAPVPEAAATPVIIRPAPVIKPKPAKRPVAVFNTGERIG